MQTTVVGRWILVPYRFWIAARYHLKPLAKVIPWLFRSREPTDFTYELTGVNSRYLAEFLHVVTGVTTEEMAGYIEELSADKELWAHVREMTLQSPMRHISDADPAPGRRVAWYALVRATKPKVVLEAGVNKGLGTCILAAALARNADEGEPGRVYGIDLIPGKGYLFGPPYDRFGEIVISDILDFLRTTNAVIDIVIHETVNVIALERETYRLAGSRLATGALVCAAWSSPALIDFAHLTGRDCLSFASEPENHWYPGERIAVAFQPRSSGSDGVLG